MEVSGLREIYTIMRDNLYHFSKCIDSVDGGVTYFRGLLTAKRRENDGEFRGRRNRLCGKPGSTKSAGG